VQQQARDARFEFSAVAADFQLRKAKRGIGRNNSVVNGWAGRATSIVDEAYPEASDA
jgi:hypothetical protein